MVIMMMAIIMRMIMVLVLVLVLVMVKKIVLMMVTKRFSVQCPFTYFRSSTGFSLLRFIFESTFVVPTQLSSDVSSSSAQFHSQTSVYLCLGLSVSSGGMLQPFQLRVSLNLGWGQNHPALFFLLTVQLFNC